MRTHRLFLFSVALLSLFSFIGCSHKPIVPRITFATQFDNGQTINIQEKGTLHLELDTTNKENAKWQIAEPLPAQLKLTEEPAYRAYTDSMGSGNMMYFKFTAGDTGTGTLSLDYVQNGSGKALKQFSTTVNVVKNNDPFGQKKRPDDSENASEKSWWKIW